MRYVVAILAALILFAAAPSAQAQYCWDTVCAAGTPAADCWRAYCPTYAPSPAYRYTPAAWPSYSWPSYSPTYSPIVLPRPLDTWDDIRRTDEIRQQVRQELNYYR